MSAFNALSDQTRRDILTMLYEGDKPAGEISARFSVSKASISHHLNVLKSAQLVTSERRGQEIWYSLNMTVLQETLLGFWRVFDGKEEK